MALKKILVTGGAGFIGSALVRDLVGKGKAEVLNFDKLTYAGNSSSLKEVDTNPLYHFAYGDICDANTVAKVLRDFKPDSIIHLAAESHVDRSIDGPLAFVQTNAVGTANLLNEATAYWQRLAPEKKQAFRFQHVSTDEVYGSLGAEGFFTEETPYSPHSPYSASKAASDHLVRAWHDTFGLPVLLTNCSNNYGPYHFPEKLIPLTILNALEGRALPVYGKGANVRDWLYVEDHVRALELVNTDGVPGRTYNIGGHSERTNLQVVQSICETLDRLAPAERPHAELISFVEDRPGHDLRYAIDSSRIEKELGWKPSVQFEEGLAKTVQWYLDNEWWWRPIREKKYAGRRLGSGK